MSQGSPNGRRPSIKGRTTPPGSYTSWDEYMADVETLEAMTAPGAATRRADYEANADISLQISKAMRLAPNVIVFNALLDGQEVPRDALDQKWRRRYRQ